MNFMKWRMCYHYYSCHEVQGISQVFVATFEYVSATLNFVSPLRFWNGGSDTVAAVFIPWILYPLCVVVSNHRNIFIFKLPKNKLISLRFVSFFFCTDVKLCGFRNHLRKKLLRNNIRTDGLSVWGDGRYFCTGKRYGRCLWNCNPTFVGVLWLNLGNHLLPTFQTSLWNASFFYTWTPQRPIFQFESFLSLKHGPLQASRNCCATKQVIFFCSSKWMLCNWY